MNKELKKTIKSISLVFIAALLMAANIKSFVRAGNLIPGGFTGLSLLIQRILIIFFNMEIPYSFINMTLNAVPAIIGYK